MKAAFGPRVRLTVHHRADGLCEMCSGPGDWRGLQFHHRLPRRRGSTHRAYVGQAANAALLCGADHDWVESNRTEAYEMGLLLHDLDIPSEVPAQLRYGLVLLSDDGSVTPVEVAR